MFVPRVITESGIEARVAQIIEPVIEDLGYQLVRIKLSSRDGSTLQIMAERPNGEMNVEDCAIVSRAISPVLDVEDPIDRNYHLEISTPGIDRPLVRPKDFKDWVGFEVKIESQMMRDGRKRYRGLLKQADDEQILLYIEDAVGGPVEEKFMLTELEDAKLVMTDALVAAALKRSKAKQAELNEKGEVSFIEDDETSKTHH